MTSINDYHLMAPSRQDVSQVSGVGLIPVHICYDPGELASVIGGN